MSTAQKEENSRSRSSSLKGSAGIRPANKHEGNADGNEGAVVPSDVKKQTTKAERRALQVHIVFKSMKYYYSGNNLSGMPLIIPFTLFKIYAPASAKLLYLI